MNKKIGLYIRVSSEKQMEEGFSFQAQEEKLINEAQREKQDYIVYKDGGVSGTKTEARAGLKLLMTDVERGIIGKVYVTKISRLARNSRDLQNLVYEFEKNNVYFKSISDGIDTSTPMGNVMVKLMGIFAEMERDTIMEQTRSGAEKRAKEGKMYGSAPVFGYDRVIDETSKKNTMKIVFNPKEKKIVETIFEMYLGGYGYKAITNKLNKEGYRTKKHKLFAINTVKTILDNPLYAGYIRYGKYKDWTKKRRKGLVTSPILVEGNHQAIISKEDYDKVQDKMKQNQRRKPPVGKYMLAGVLTCPECGSKMVGSKTKYKTKNGPVERLYYTCSQFHNKGLTACHSNGIRVDLIDPIAIKKIAKKLNSPELVDTLYKYITENTIDENSIDGKRRIIEIEIEKQATCKIELRKLYTEGIITASELKEDIEKINHKTDEYQLLLTELDQDDSIQKSQSFEISKQDVESFLSDI
ncbi:MAG: recombinase family protein, partial [Firmicutes bacterium]|nr:recombinase family protein [Bacillota bacterium]